MTLSDAVSNYVHGRRVCGSPFVSSENTLRSFCRHCGPIELEQVTAERVANFLNAGKTSQVTRVSKFSALRCFIEHYTTRRVLPVMPLARPAKPRSYRAPFIYTRGQVRALLSKTGRCQSKAAALDGNTFRMALLLLYSTGGTVSDVLSLRRSDVDLRRKRITFRAIGSRPGRALPLGASIGKALSQYFRDTGLKSGQDTFVLRCSTGKPLKQKYLCECFTRLRRLVDIQTGVPGCPARLQDFRYTFAVHRLQTWIAAGMDLNAMIPALSAYMGYASLGKAEEFLAYAPARFREDLNKLSRIKCQRQWNSDPALMTFLTQP